MRLANALCQFAEVAAEATVSGSRSEGMS
jgi:hypothetical protein